MKDIKELSKQNNYSELKSSSRHRQAGGGSCQIVYRLRSHHPGDPHRATADDKLPHGPCKSLSADYLGPFPSGEYLLVMMHNYSRFLIVEVVSSTAIDVAIRAFDCTFALMGGITYLKTDNGSPFKSQQFADFAKSSGFTHHKVTPLFPSANGFSERFYAVP